jgi:pimeloyl-ACP methyl ester carboxylesterase
MSGMAIGLSIAAAATALMLSPHVRRSVQPLRRLVTSTAASSGSAMSGMLFKFKAESWPAPLQAFESPAGHAHKKYAVYVGGLTDGLLACAYVHKLGEELDRLGWALVQPVLSSSYAMYGTSSLARDAEELSELLLTIDRRSSPMAFAIIGHSTGCQDAVSLLRVAPPAVRAKLRAAVLQAPVSDRESNAATPDPDGVNKRMLAEAERLVAQGSGDRLLSDKHYGFVPMTASRFLSLAGVLGPDDMFSSDLSEADLALRLGHMGTHGQRAGVRAPPSGALPAASVSGIAPQSEQDGWICDPVPEHPGLRTVFVYSGSDEYVPSFVDVPALAERMVAAAGGASNGAEAVAIDAANHNLATPSAAADSFVSCVCQVLKEVE